MKRSLTGIQPTGNVHLGNYLGMIKPALELQSDYHCFYFIADLHAVTTMRDPVALQASVLDIVAIFLALGLDTSKQVMFRQSDVAEVTELAWYLSCVTGMGLLNKAHAYKDAVAKGKEANHGLFAYPVLMAADILLYDTEVVPVGKDQKQHVEMSRDMALSFNAAFGSEVLKLPEPRIKADVMTVPGLDGQKMSKSYNNEIPLFAEEKLVRKKVMSIATDSTPLEAPKTLQPESVLAQLYSLFASPAQLVDLDARLQKGGYGWGHAKEELATLICDSLREPRERYLKLRADENALNKELDRGTERASEVATGVLNRVRSAVGMRAVAKRASRA